MTTGPWGYVFRLRNAGGESFFVFCNMFQSLPLFVYFCPFHITKLN